jgi:hypothetical protein
MKLVCHTREILRRGFARISTDKSRRISFPIHDKRYAILAAMSRPLGVSIIGCCCFLAGIYLCSIAAVVLIVPRVVPILRSAPLIHELKLANPFATLAVGIVWAFVAWGLLRMKDWARWVAQILLGIGVAWVVPMIFLTQMHFGWRLLAVCLQIILRAAAVVYLFAPSVMDAFQAGRSRSSSLPTN